MPTNLNKSISSHPYKVYIYDIKSKKKITTIPATSLSFGRELNNYAEAEINLTINPTTSVSGKLASNLSVGRRTIYIFRNNKIVWGGLLYEWAYSSNERSLRITGRTFEWYLYRRFNRTTKHFKKVDQFSIVRTIANNALKDINSTVTTSNSGVKRDIKLYSYDFKTLGDQIHDIGERVKGFDWGFTIGVTSKGVPTRKFNMYYKNRGKTKAKTKLAFRYPTGSIINYTYTKTMADASTRIYTLGAGEGKEMLVQSALKGNMSGYVIFDESYTYSSVKKNSTLKSHANARLKQKVAPITLLDVTLRANRADTPTIGSFNVGDWALFRINDWMFPNGLKFYMRIVALKVNLSEDGLETIDLTLSTEREEIFDDSAADNDD